jgi:hypothetical protein
MHYPFRSGLKRIAAGQVVLPAGINLDLLIGVIADANAVETVGDIASLLLGQPKNIPLAVHEEEDYIQYYTTIEAEHRHLIYAVADAIDIQGMVGYSSTGDLLFFVDFGGIKHSQEGAFNVGFPETLLYMRARISG